MKECVNAVHYSLYSSGVVILSAELNLQMQSIGGLYSRQFGSAICTATFMLACIMVAFTYRFAIS